MASYFLLLISGVALTVDENLYYKGVDKEKIDKARLTQSAHEDPQDTTPSDPSVQAQDKPPYLFHSGESLLKLTREHNVGEFLPCECLLELLVDDDRSARLG